MKFLMPLLLLLGQSAFGQIWGSFSDLAYMNQGRPAAAVTPLPPEWQNMAFRLTATNVATGSVSAWTDIIQGLSYPQANGALQPSKAAGSTNGVYFFRGGGQYLQSSSTFGVTQTADAQNDYVVYCIFKPVSTPSGVYYGLWGTASGGSQGIHPSMTVNVSSDDIYGTCVLNQLNVFVANEGYYNTNRGRWMNRLTNSTSTQAYATASRPFSIQQIGELQLFNYYMDGPIYEIGVLTNKTFTATMANAIYDYATNQFR